MRRLRSSSVGSQTARYQINRPVMSKEVSEQRAAFDKEIMPMFASRCVQCHGAGKPMGGLDLRSLQALLKGSSNGAVVMEGFSEKSVLIRKLASRSMPPPGTGQPLGDDQIEGIRKWVDKGHFLDPARFKNLPTVSSQRQRLRRSRQRIASSGLFENP